MIRRRALMTWLGVVSLGLWGGCTPKRVHLGELTKPARSAELDAYSVFVGTWDWTATMPTADGDKTWTGTAEWNWTLDKRCLYGHLSSKTTGTAFEADGIWTWHPTKKKYHWWIFNDWGYPQEGTATWDAKGRKWTMPYTSVGLDGTTSHGRYVLTVTDPNTIEWRMQEWADALHTIKKVEMTGGYTRRR